MKARLAKKLAHTPANRLSRVWIDRLAGNDTRLETAIRMWSRKSYHGIE
jgi:hypothetical protein